MNGQRNWLGGLDSNQDSQLQRLMYCQLYDLPAEGGGNKPPLPPAGIGFLASGHFYFIQ